MFGALIKAFTGRAGFLSSLLALSIIALTSAAVLLSLPRIEQKLENSAQTVLSESLGDSDSLDSFRVDGRELLLEGRFEDAPALSAKLSEIEGVRSVLINGGGSEPIIPDEPDAQAPEAAVDSVADASVQDAPVVADTEITSDVQHDEVDTDQLTGAVDMDTAQEQAPAVSPEVVADEAEDSTASGEPLAQSIPDPADSNDSASDDQAFDQSSLSLRYDGTQLSLSGHLADEQLAQLVAKRVTEAVPAQYELAINLDGKGKGSPLNWMREFLATVADLPDDAQGRIEGSDASGVQIIPDAEQTLTAREPVPVEAEADADAVEAAEAPVDDVSAEVTVDEVEQPEAAPDEDVSQAEVVAVVDTQAEESIMEVGVEQAPEVAVVDTAESGAEVVSVALSPEDFITGLNSRLTEQAFFALGDYSITEALQVELDGLIGMMRQNPDLLLRIVGNLDFSVSRRDAEYVGIDRAREIRDYLAMQQIEPFRVFATPLPRDRAYDKRVQVVFYISE